MAVATEPSVMKKRLKKTTFISVFCMAVYFVSGPAFAQTPIIEGAASAGTGASFGKGEAETVVLMSPAYIDIDIIYSSSERPNLEYVIGLQAELQGRVSAGIVPQFRLSNAPAKWTVYGVIGVPVVFAPFVLVGVEAGAGLLWRIKPQFGVFVECVADLFFLGNDLQDGGMLAQIDGNLGIRVTF